VSQALEVSPGVFGANAIAMIGIMQCEPLLLDRLVKRPQMALESRQSLNQRVQGPFGVFRIGTVGPEPFDKSFLTLNDATGFGNTTLGRRETLVSAFCLSHPQICAAPPQGVFDLNQSLDRTKPILLQHHAAVRQPDFAANLQIARIRSTTGPSTI
jgi:hypothetical protein